MSDYKLLVVSGPTASGKTELGIRLAEALNGEIISADSMQIYKGLDIGTAKPTKAERARVPHHLIDILEPHESYSVAAFVKDAEAVSEDILRRGKLPIVVGGTWLYIDSLLKGREFSQEGDEELRRLTRKELEERYDEIGGAGMLGELRQFDPERAERLSVNDKKRIVRAYEFFLLTGKTISQFDKESLELTGKFNSLCFALGFKNRKTLYGRIERRVEKMLKEGILAEAEYLMSLKLPQSAGAMQAIGYKELFPYLGGECSLSDAEAELKKNSRRYAKRQLSFMRSAENLNWIEFDSDPDMDFAVRKVLSKIEKENFLVN